MREHEASGTRYAQICGSQRLTFFRAGSTGSSRSFRSWAIVTGSYFSRILSHTTLLTHMPGTRPRCLCRTHQAQSCLWSKYRPMCIFSRLAKSSTYSSYATFACERGPSDFTARPVHGTAVCVYVSGGGSPGSRRAVGRGTACTSSSAAKCAHRWRGTRRPSRPYKPQRRRFHRFKSRWGVGGCGCSRPWAAHFPPPFPPQPPPRPSKPLPPSKPFPPKSL